MPIRRGDGPADRSADDGVLVDQDLPLSGAEGFDEVRRRAAVIVAELDAPTASRIRLAPSPAAETVAWLRLAVAGSRDSLVGRPRLVGPLARDPDVRLLATLVRASSHGYLPDLLTPKPGTAEVLRRQLAQVEATSDEEVRHHVGAPSGDR